jgi:hypothetical protein
MNSYISDFKLVITSEDTPCRFRCASTFKRLRTRRSNNPCQLPFRTLYRKPTQFDRLTMAQSSARSKFKPRPVHLGFVVDKVVVGQVFFLEDFCFHLSVSFHQHSIPFIHLLPTLHNPQQLTASLNNTPLTPTYRTSQRASLHGIVLWVRHKVTQDSEFDNQF